MLLRYLIIRWTERLLLTNICHSLDIFQFLLLGAVPFPNDVPRLQQLGVRGVITLNEPYETLVPSSLYMVTFAFLNAFTSRNAFST